MVDVPPELQIDRMVRERGWTREEAHRASPPRPRRDRLAIATYVIDNTGSLEDLRARVEVVYAALTAGP